MIPPEWPNPMLEAGWVCLALLRNCKFPIFGGQLRHALFIDGTRHFNRVESFSEQLDLSVAGNQATEEELVDLATGLC
jgi:hypothetical protein